MNKFNDNRQRNIFLSLYVKNSMENKSTQISFV